MSDLIERLREARQDIRALDAADEIDRLNERIKVLESDDHEWYLQAERIAKLEALIKIMAEDPTNAALIAEATLAALQEVDDAPL